MPSKLDTVAEVRQRLLRKGFARSYANRTATELREHWEDLLEEGARQGLTREEAIGHADQRLGKPQALAEEIAERMKDSSWLARNPTAGFAGLSLMATIVWWSVLLLAAGTATGLLRWDPSSTGGPRPNMTAASMWIDWIRAGSFLVIPFLCCLIAQRYYCGWQAALWGCLIAAIHGATHVFNAEGDPGSGTVYWGYSLSLAGPRQWLPILAPLAVFVIWTLWNRRDEGGSGPRFC